MSESVNQIATSTLTGILEFLKYLLFRTGILSIPFQPLSIFARSTALSSTSELITTPVPTKSAKKNAKLGIHDLDDAIPDIELMPLATSGSDNLEEHFKLFSKIGMFTLLATVLQPKSRGTVRLASSDALDRPRVDFGFLSSPSDFIVARKAVRLALKFGESIRAAGFPLLRGVLVPKGESDEEVDAFIRHRARTTYHYASSCRMGAEFDDVPGVVDDELRVHGVSNLRVCDASVFPRIIATHLQAPVVMVAEKCADLIKRGLKKEV
jgi:choline dehydrogenase-like flavoprotein